jgi:hypothetical protein
VAFRTTFKTSGKIRTESWKYWRVGSPDVVCWSLELNKLMQMSVLMIVTGIASWYRNMAIELPTGYNLAFFSNFDQNIGTFQYFCKWPSVFLDRIIEGKIQWLSGLLSKMSGKINTEGLPALWHQRQPDLEDFWYSSSPVNGYHGYQLAPIYKELLSWVTAEDQQWTR